ncbi:MAG TPA: hypothetical protein VN764_09255, partial [Polyangiaceae bacterium]|nr:hypothetical protein [Polyangiaceae bacterium]
CQGNGGLLIADNTALTEFAAFSSLERSAGDVCVLDLGSQLDNGGGSTEDLQALFPTEAATASSVVSFPALRQVDGGIEVSYSSQLNAITFPELRRAEFLYVNSSSWSETAYNDTFEELSLPKLQDVGYFQVNGNCGFERLNAPRLTSAYYLFLDANCNGSAAASAEFDLDALESVYYLSFYVYTDPSGSRPVQLNVPALTEAEQVSLSVYGDGITDISFPELQRVNWLYTTFASSTLASLRFPKVETMSTLNLSVQPSEGQDPPTALALIDFSKLESADTIYLNAPIAVVNQNSGLRMPNLTTVGTYDSNEDNQPDNNGVAQLCTGYSASDEPPYVNAACGVMQKLVNSGYSGEPDTCSQCDLAGPMGSLKALQVVASYEHSCALLTDGTVS